MSYRSLGLLALLGVFSLSACGDGGDGGDDTPPECTTAAACDDGDACTTDACSAAGACTHTPVAVDDLDACTTDACDAVDGVTHAPVAVDDLDACTTDACDPATGAVTHAPVAVDDLDACTTDACDPATGAVTHAPVAVDDQDACTTDACDPATGAVTHAPVAVDDLDACTVDTCDPVTGVAVHTPIAGIDDGLACTTDACDPATGGVTHAASDLACGSGNVCGISGCTAATPADQDGHVIVNEMLPVAGAAGNAGELVELRNTTGASIDVRGFTLRNQAGQTADLRAASDPTGAAGTAIVIPAGGVAYGVANPTAAGDIPGDAAFVYGAPGGTFTLADAGDHLEVLSAAGALEDFVSFIAAHDDPATTVPLMAFAFLSAVSTQLDPGAATATGNDVPLSWCVTFYPAAPAARVAVSDTAGAANGSCSAVVISEVFVDPSGTDDGKTFIEIAGPGGALVGGVTIEDVEGQGATAGARNGTTQTIPAGTRLPVDGILLLADETGSTGSTGVIGFGAVDVVLNDVDLENGGGDGVQLVSATGTLLDAFAHGASALATDTATFNGLAIVEGTLAPVAVTNASAARNLAAADSDDNAADFHLDPTPSPGVANAPVTPTISALLPDDLPTNIGSSQLAVTGTDFIAGITVTLTGGTPLNCSVTSATTMSCIASNAMVGVARRADATFTWPVAFGLTPVTLTDGFTWTGSRNDSNAAEEADFCNLQFPDSITLTQGQSTPQIFARLFEAGVTEAGGAPAGVLAEIGLGPSASFPPSSGGWSFVAAAYSVQVGNDDEYAATLVAPAVVAPTSFAYTSRFSFDGGLTFTYCDLNGAGSNPGLTFESAQLGSMTVNP